MCGICGIWYFDPEHPVNPALLQAMTDEIHHRGPDEGGYHIDGSVGLGFRRLSIIDVGGSHQPMPNEDERIWIVFNGEIYNFQELRADLAARHSFRTAGDTETILHAYEEFGARCVDQFRGMFAFAIWDGVARRLTLAVDRFGKKPVYYWLDGEKVVFGSEMKCIMQHPNLDRTLDLDALDEYLTYGYITAPKTILKAVRKLEPGHTLTISQDGRAQHDQYWHPDLCAEREQDNRPLDELAAELRGLLTDAVRLRMISDVPLGAFLSGGVDSSAVVGLMSQISDQPVKTFSIGFDEAAYDETHYAQIVADYCKTDHVREVVRPDVVNILPKLIHQFDEPFADSSMIPTYYVSEVARKYVTVALSGDGGDEVFGGYPWYRYGGRHQLLQSIIPVSLRPAAEAVGQAMPRFTRVGGYMTEVSKPTRHWGMRFKFFDPAQRAALYQPSLAAELAHFPGERAKTEAFDRAGGLDWLAQLQYSDLTNYMPGDILVKVDRASMLASLEVRSPLLDHKVFEFMARIPPRYKTSLTDSKILLKKAVGSLLPPQIHTRNKQGFGIPLGEWLAHPLEPMLRETLLGTASRERGLFNIPLVSTMIDEHTSGRKDHRERLWGLFCFELWAQEYLDR